MQRLKLLGVALMAVFALSAIASVATASANPTILPEPTEKAPLLYSFLGIEKSVPVLEGTKEGSEIKCTVILGKGDFTSGESGPVDIDFEGCTATKGGASCTTAGDAKGTILAKATATLVDFKVGGVLELGILFTNVKLTVPCGALTIEIQGSAIGKVDNVKNNVKTKAALVLVHQTKGEQAITTCELLEAVCKGKTFKLESNVGKGFELAGEEAEANITFEKEAEVHF